MSVETLVALHIEASNIDDFHIRCPAKGCFSPDLVCRMFHMKRQLHRLRHWLHWQPIEVISEWRGTQLWIGARCVVCGEVTSWTRSRARLNDDEQAKFAAILQRGEQVLNERRQP